jgi:aspartate ammonia-lyase
MYMKNFRTGFLLSAILLSACGSFAQTRTEKDLLGEKQIPADAYFMCRQPNLENLQWGSMKTNLFRLCPCICQHKLAAWRMPKRAGLPKMDVIERPAMQ